MSKEGIVKGFSRLSRDEKIKWLQEYLSDDTLESFLHSFRISDTYVQNNFEKFAENTLSNYHLPYSIVPNVMIDGNIYHVPVAIEESSVVAAASKAASFWAERGGFITTKICTIKKGQVHFFFHDNPQLLLKCWDKVVADLLKDIAPFTQSMQKRGGGVLALHLKDAAEIDYDYFQLEMKAETVDSMGANFINTILEKIAQSLPVFIKKYTGSDNVEVLMAILSNYTPECIVSIRLETLVKSLNWDKNLSPLVFANRMKQAADIACHDVGRAVTHNKGIYNGVDAVVLATGNDFRAVEASGHAYAARSGKYRSLSKVILKDDIFKMEMSLPLALGTVGGLTNLHPLAKKSLQILQNPDSKTLMKVAASVGLANNFAAMASLVTTGIQKGHMKMHLHNILALLQVNEERFFEIQSFFADKTVSVSAVKEYMEKNP